MSALSLVLKLLLQLLPDLLLLLPQPRRALTLHFQHVVAKQQSLLSQPLLSQTHQLCTFLLQYLLQDGVLALHIVQSRLGGELRGCCRC